MTDIESLSPPMQAAIAAHLSERLGERIEVTEATRREVLSSSRLRTFHLARVRSADGRERLLHVRLTAWRFRQRDRNRLDAYLSERGMPTPAFFGVVEHEGQVATLWEHCDGQSHRSFKFLTRDQVDAVIRGMALISARSDDVRQHTQTRRGMRWVHSIADEIMAFARGDDTLMQQEKLIEHLSLSEDAVIQRAEAQDLWVLTHNDLVARNVIAMPDGSVRLLDWDSATIAPAGASLRALNYSATSRAEAVADLYSSEMRRHGLNVQSPDVLFMMKAQQIFWNLSSGVQRRDLRRLTKGLALFRSTFPESPSRQRRAPPMTPSPSLSGEYPRPAPESLKALVRECMDQKGRGRLYSMIPHPDFAHLPASRGADRFALIRPHLSPEGGTALDLGAHFATFSHWLEDAGYKVTAVEHSPLYAEVARQVRDLNGKTFEVIEGSIFDLGDLRYDVVLALNIFHHFLKTKRRFEGFEALLARTHCDVMFFESHVESEGQMKDAYRNMNPQEFARFIAERTGLTEITEIGHDKNRIVFKLARPK